MLTVPTQFSTPLFRSVVVAVVGRLLLLVVPVVVAQTWALVQQVPQGKVTLVAVVAGQTLTVLAVAVVPVLRVVSVPQTLVVLGVTVLLRVLQAHRCIERAVAVKFAQK